MAFFISKQGVIGRFAEKSPNINPRHFGKEGMYVIVATT
jgi:hypothetical protein